MQGDFIRGNDSQKLIPGENPGLHSNYRPPQLVSLGKLQNFILAGGPGSGDVALPDTEAVS